ncbi:alpha-glucuronidase [Paenibacillus sp. T3-5-0-4]|uniref:alpha-glucuronidase family glycosyl hydrolase n=1 Tax=Paenibacillus endoradicis TaxID=2972487 RepID=UPI002158EE08|nr:alpha-glucuronidase family glycosyl hydrolase [Paenibacillus endoradicis]MCR8660644.1 alpha-glucuronidase [Paenibacillus endoradicis]
MHHEQAWLNYNTVCNPNYKKYATDVFCNQIDEITRSAISELRAAFQNLFDKQIVATESSGQAAIKLLIVRNDQLGIEGFQLDIKEDEVVIESQYSIGLLYGTFHLLRLLQTEKNIELGSIVEIPSQPLRMVNHWDNLDGSIERGYSGQSFFFENNEIIINERTVDYARLTASVGINGVVINNVNVRKEATQLITDRYLDRLKEMKNIFSAYGIKLFISLNFAAPMEIGMLETADPLDSSVINWWRTQLDYVHGYIPGFDGFLIKADSEGRPGPFTYNRTHADGANMLADIIKPYGGIIIWRCFVYNCQQDWRDTVTDRARAGYDNFVPLDGTLHSNVILQIKNGPMDFQVREPVSPLFGGLKATNQMLEVQIAQEYTGQQRHVAYLLPMFKEILDFRTHCDSAFDTVNDIVSGKTFDQPLGGIAAVINTGNDENWTGHDLAAVNWYGFGRLSSNPNLLAEQIAIEWIKLTYGNDEFVIQQILSILMPSWETYEKYTSPLGIGWMVNPGHHYGPNVEGYEYSRWGTYHRADQRGLGVDRTSKGTGYSTQYQSLNALMYESIDKCPEPLLLFFHYVEYTHHLKSGKSLIQHIYDTHFEGVEEVASMLKRWRSIEDKIERKIYDRVLERLQHQYSHSTEWRDIICSYFYRKSGIQDVHNRQIY